jgi:N-terminal domain of (some) glycogen debranching enzymes
MGDDPGYVKRPRRSPPGSGLLTFTPRTQFGGGGRRQSHDAVTTDEHRIPHRALDLDLRYHVDLASLDVTVDVRNRSGRAVDFEIAWILDADYADVQEALSGVREQQAEVEITSGVCSLHFVYRDPELSYCTDTRISGPGPWTAADGRLAARVRLASQELASRPCS